MAHRTRPVVEVLLRVAAEMLEGGLMRIEKRAQRFVEIGHVDAPPRKSQREHEDVAHDRLRAEDHARLAPIDLALLPGRRLEPRPGQIRAARRRTQRADETAHRRVAARVRVLLAVTLDTGSAPSSPSATRQADWKMRQSERPCATSLRVVKLPSGSARDGFVSG
jgi:hypothetical protein